MKENFELYIFLYLSFASEKRVSDFLNKEVGIKRDLIQRGMHLTVYYSRRPMPLLQIDKEYLSIKADVNETRFMVLAPGGENPRPHLHPSLRSVGIRLTKRNLAIPEIVRIRRSVYKHEPQFTNRRNTTDWLNSFGARHYQPHIKLLRAGNGIDRDLTIIGDRFRKSIQTLEFQKLEKKIYER